jgi:putative membrane protein
VSELAAAVAGCERIPRSPIPSAYGVLLHRAIYLYCFMLPFGLVGDLGMATPLVSVFAPTSCSRWRRLASLMTPVRRR